jgi:hypothetical protein
VIERRTFPVRAKGMFHGRASGEVRPLETFEDLLPSFAEGAKPKDQWRIGTEHEKFGFHTDDFTPVAWDGDRWDQGAAGRHAGPEPLGRHL